MSLAQRSASRNGAESKTIDDDVNLQDSWVDLAPPSRGSTSSITTCTDPGLLIDATSSNKGSRHSPKSLHSPNIEFTTTLEAVKYRLAKISPANRNTDWIWDWSSRPEAVPPRQFRFRHPGGTMTTPPNSPVDSATSHRSYSWSLRNSKIIDSDWFTIESLSRQFVTLVVGICIGFVIAKKFSRIQPA